MELFGREYIYDHFITHMRQKRHTDTIEYYKAMALYAISNGHKMTQTLFDILGKSETEDTADGKETAEKVAKKLGVKINWGGETA